MESPPLEPESSASANFTTLAYAFAEKAKDLFDYCFNQGAVFNTNPICVSACGNTFLDFTVGYFDRAVVLQPDRIYIII